MIDEVVRYVIELNVDKQMAHEFLCSYVMTVIMTNIHKIIWLNRDSDIAQIARTIRDKMSLILMNSYKKWQNEITNFFQIMLSFYSDFYRTK